MKQLSDLPRVSFVRAHPSQASRTERAASSTQPVLSLTEAIQRYLRKSLSFPLESNQGGDVRPKPSRSLRHSVCEGWPLSFLVWAPLPDRLLIGARVRLSAGLGDTWLRGTEPGAEDELGEPNVTARQPVWLMCLSRGLGRMRSNQGYWTEPRAQAKARKCWTDRG